MARAEAAVGRAVTAFADRILTTDLPRLPAERRAETSAFVAARVGRIGGPARLGVAAVALVLHGVAAIPVIGGRTVHFVAARPLPIVGEYGRLVRSLGYAFVWERWPDTRVDGRPGPPVTP